MRKYTTPIGRQRRSPDEHRAGVGAELRALIRIVESEHRNPEARGDDPDDQA